ncbi:hypothetical protein B0H11DRAFT_1917660 [Mycena galericulata]|nr:hypothetical protein B0H11DRAFT_1917660 [Mycena galericulata]
MLPVQYYSLQARYADSGPSRFPESESASESDASIRPRNRETRNKQSLVYGKEFGSPSVGRNDERSALAWHYIAPKFNNWQSRQLAMLQSAIGKALAHSLDPSSRLGIQGENQPCSIVSRTLFVVISDSDSDSDDTSGFVYRSGCDIMSSSRQIGKEAGILRPVSSVDAPNTPPSRDSAATISQTAEMKITIQRSRYIFLNPDSGS